MTRDVFLRKATEKHGDRYQYHKVGEVDSTMTPVTIYCPECAQDFTQKVTLHLTGHGCSFCNKGYLPRTTENVIADARLIYPGKFTYEKTVYRGFKVPVTVTCTACGEDTEMSPNNLVNSGTAACSNCSKTRKRTLDEFIAKAKKVHGNQYDYSKVEYVNNDTLVTIRCLRCDHEFEQAPRNHTSMKSGCHRCAALRSERMAVEMLEDVTGSKFRKVRPLWLEGLELDAYNEDLKLALEYQGEQHYRHVWWFHRTEAEFHEQQERDRCKRALCQINDVRLIEVPFQFNYKCPDEMREFIAIAAI
jgi:protein-arginine kinase activator protein McsA